MKSLTIHGIEDPLWSLLKSKSEFEGVSLNKTVKTLLETALGVSKQENTARREEFQSFLGCWTKKDAEQFSTAIADLESIDPREWK